MRKTCLRSTEGGDQPEAADIARRKSRNRGD